MKENWLEGNNIKLLKDVEQIGETPVRFFSSKAEIKQYVELPMVKAAEVLYDKNIRTTAAHAQRDAISTGIVSLSFAFDELSDENKEIARRLGMDNSKTIQIPVTEKTTVKEIEDASLEIASQFKKQPLTWGVFTDGDVRRKYRLEPDYKIAPEDLGIVYDHDSQLFFASEELREKYGDSL